MNFLIVLKVLIMRLVDLFTGPPEDIWEVAKIVGGIIIFAKIMKLAKASPSYFEDEDEDSSIPQVYYDNRNSWSTTVGATPEVMRSNYHSGPFPMNGEGTKK